MWFCAVGSPFRALVLNELLRTSFPLGSRVVLGTPSPSCYTFGGTASEWLWWERILLSPSLASFLLAVNPLQRESLKFRSSMFHISKCCMQQVHPDQRLS